MDKSQKKKAAVSAVAAVTAAGVLVGGTFTSPADLLDDAPDALVQTLDMDMDGQTDAGDDSGDGEEEEARSKPGSAVRRLVLQIPTPLRAVVALPLWLLGALLINLGSTLWSAVLSPVFSAVLSWVAVAVMVLITFLLAAKTVAPDLPIKKILNKHSVLGILGLCLGFGLLDSLLPLVWDEYLRFSQVVKAIGSCICTAVPIAFFLRWNSRRLKKKEEELVEAEEELSYEEREKAARELILELADSVSRRY